MDRPEKISFVMIVVLVGLSICLTIAIWQIRLQASTTLHSIDRWETSKTNLERGVVGAIAFRTTRPPLHRNRLDLGAYHGFQEVFLTEPIDFEHIEFAFMLSEGAHVSILIEVDSHDATAGYTGVRLSRHARLPTAAFNSLPDGRFISLQPIKDAPTIDGSWNELSLKNTKSGIEVGLNGGTIATLDPLVNDARRIGFRGGAHPSYIDNIIVTQRINGSKFTEYFSFNGGTTYLLFASGTFVVFFNLLAYLFFRWIERDSGALRASALIVINFLVLVMVTIYGIFDYYYLSSQYHAKIDYFEYPKRIESGQNVLDKLQEKLETLGESESKRRILFVGSSQTWGAGAGREDETWIAQLEKSLNSDERLQGTFDCINAGISGATSSSLISHFENWLRFKPEIVVVDLSGNDKDPGVFADNLERFSELARDSGAEIVFVLEPNSIETPDAGLLQKHDAMKRVAERLGVHLIDMQAYFTDNPDQGFLWWDKVHLSSGGQAIFADRMHSELMPVLNPS